MDFPLKIASRQQTRYSTTQCCFILLLFHVMWSSGKFLSLLKRMHFVLSLPKWSDQQTNRIYLQILNWKHFRFPERSYFGKRYLWRLHIGIYEYLRKPVECHWYIVKTKKVLIQIFGELHSSWSLLLKRRCLMKWKSSICDKH